MDQRCAVRRRVPWIVVALLASGVASVAVLPPVAAGAASKPSTGGTLTVGSTQEIPSMDPARATIGGANTGVDRMFLVYGTLMQFDSRSGQVIPSLAQSLTSSDGQTWTLKLRQGVKFSDGTPLDADAVIFNFGRLKDPANTFSGIAAVSQISKMTAIDPQTVEFKLIQPNGSFSTVFTDIVGSPASPTAIKADPRNWAQRPVGAGPYVLKEWVRDDHMTFTRNPTYWDKPRPYIDTIVERIIPNRTTITESLRSGSIDVVHIATYTELKLATDNPKQFQHWNVAAANGAIGIVCNIAVTPCSDVRFREGVALSFDFNVIKQTYLQQVDFPAKTMVCPPFGVASPFCVRDIKLRYDPDRARKLFAAVKADGISTDVTYTFNRGALLGDGQGEFVQQQLAKVGVNVTVRSVTTPEYIASQSAHTYQMAVSYSPTSADPTTRVYNDLHSAGGVNGGRDVANADNAQLDVALEQGRNAPKLSDRIAGMQEAQRIVAKNRIVTWLWPYGSGNVANKRLHLAPFQTADDQLYRYEQAWVSNK